MASYVIWSCCWAYWRSMTTMFLLPTSQSPIDATRIVQRRDQPTLRRSCYWAFNDDNVLTSDVSEPNWCDQDRPASRSTYTTILLLLNLLAFNDDNVLTMDATRIVQRRDQPTLRSSYFRRMGPVDATRFKCRDQPPQRVVDLNRVDYDVLASDVWWHSLTGVEKNLLL